MGAVAGALVGEFSLIQIFGLRGTGLFAGLLNLLAAFGALNLLKKSLMEETEPAPGSPLSIRTALSGRGHRLLMAAFLAGGVILASEVVWFRFLQLFLPGTSYVFAVMLSIVLTGIGLGGFLGALWFKLDPNAHRFLFGFILIGGPLSVLVYRLFPWPVEQYSQIRHWLPALEIFWLPICLMLPVCLFSGILFALLGHAAHEVIKGEARTAGLVTMANTIGATLGPFGGRLFSHTSSGHGDFFFYPGFHVRP